MADLDFESSGRAKATESPLADKHSALTEPRFHSEPTAGADWASRSPRPLAIQMSGAPASSARTGAARPKKEDAEDAAPAAADSAESANDSNAD